MDFFEVVRNRRSYRVFKPDMPAKEIIEKILDAGRLAPTWANKQGVEYIVVQEPEMVKKIWRAIGQKAKFQEAPMFIIGIITESSSGKNGNGENYYGVDIGICFEHLILAATAEGLATCWVGWFNDVKIKKLLEIPDKYKVMAITPLGYATKSKGDVAERQPLVELVHWEKF